MSSVYMSKICDFTFAFNTTNEYNVFMADIIECVEPPTTKFLLFITKRLYCFYIL